jgi:hypothetical protein
MLSFNAYGESFLCVAEQGAGFSYNKENKELVSAKFNVSNKKYIIKKAAVRDLFEDSKWMVSSLGANSPFYWTDDDFNQFGIIFLGDFKFNRKNGRFIYSDDLGYIQSGLDKPFGAGKFKDSDYTPHMEIGRCSSIDE